MRPPSVVAASCWSQRRTVTTSATAAAAGGAAAAAAGTKLTIARPDDWHLHVRDGATLSAVVPHTARVFGRAIIMPNLVPPVRTLPEAVRPETTRQPHPTVPAAPNRGSGVPTLCYPAGARLSKP